MLVRAFARYRQCGRQFLRQLMLPASLVGLGLLALPVSAALTAPALTLSLDKSPVCASFVATMQPKYQHEAQWWPENVLQPSYAAETKLPASAPQAAPLLHFASSLSAQDWQWFNWQPLSTVPQHFGWDGVASTVIASAVSPDPRWHGRLILAVNSQQLRYFYLPADVAMPQATEIPQLLKALQPYALPSPVDAVANVFATEDGGLYQLVKPWGVQQLWPQSQAVCQLQLQPVPQLIGLNVWRETLRQSFVAAAADSLAIEQANQQLQDWLQRPWQIPQLQTQCADSDTGCVLRTHRSQWLAFFASQDAWSSREAAEIQELWLLAARELTRHFQQAYSLQEAQASELAERLLAAYFARLTPAIPSPQVVTGLRFHAELPSYPLDMWQQLSADQQLQLRQQQNGFGKTALMIAAHFNDFDSVKTLLASGAVLTAKTKANDQYALQVHARDALSYAAENAHPALISLLFSAGANAAVRDSNQQPLSVYLAKNTSLQLRQLADKSLGDIMMQGRVPKPAADCPTVRQPMPKLFCTSQGLRIYTDELQLRLQQLTRTGVTELFAEDHRRWQQQWQTQCQQKDQVALLACVKTQYRARIRMLDHLIAGTTGR